jgi:hypothetical protein
MKFLVSAAAALAATVAFPAGAAVIANASFEAATPAPWVSAGSGSVALVDQAFSALGTTFLPTDGGRFALLTAGADDDYQTLTQSFTLAQASLVSFDAAFLADDEVSDGLGFNDDGYVCIGLLGGIAARLFQSDINAVGDFGETPWTHVSVLLGPGTYSIEAGVRNVGDIANGYSPGFDSRLIFDNVAVSAAPVPEPASWALMIAGFGLVGGALRRRRSSLLQGA